MAIWTLRSAALLVKVHSTGGQGTDSPTVVSFLDSSRRLRSCLERDASGSEVFLGEAARLGAIDGVGGFFKLSLN